MKRKAWGIVAAVSMSMILGGCHTDFLETDKNVFDMVGGWIKGEEKETETEKETEKETETETKPETEKETETETQKETEAEHPEDFSGGTDEPGSGLKIELVKNIGMTAIFRITNNSDVSYESVDFLCRFSPRYRKELQMDDGKGHAYVSSDAVPAYSEVYVPVEAAGVWKLKGDSKQENSGDIFHYDPIDRMVNTKILSFEVSDEDLQDARDYIDILDERDSVEGLAGAARNRSDRPIRFHAIALGNGGSKGECAFLEHSDFLTPADWTVEGGGGERPAHVELDGEETGVALYVGDLIAPAVLEGMTREEISALGEDAFQAPGDYPDNCEILITNAYFEP